MNKNKELNDVWLKSSVVGSIWAASEIILGSFLHNLSVPFKGSILTAIGLILLISFSRIWKDKGLFWRSGLICALMKTISPSAVIFGPMIAILMESLFLELSVRIIGRNIAGFIIGSVLAMSWVFLQKIINFIIYYGFNIVEIYSNILRFSEKQFNIQFDTYWMPIFVLLGIYVIFGVSAAIAGISIARGSGKSYEDINTPNGKEIFNSDNKGKEGFNYSILWLTISAILIVGSIFLINKSKIYIWIPISISIITAWVLRYKRSMRQLSRPGFWIFFILITTLSALLISSLNGGEDSFKKGIITGLEMNFRAAILITGFAVLGTELYNPMIRERISKSSFQNIATALELGFESLPVIISILPDARTFIKRPHHVVNHLIIHAEKRFMEFKRSYAKVIVIQGDVSEGKTSFIIELIKRLKENGYNPGGIFTKKNIENGETTGYNLISIRNGERKEFLRSGREEGSEGIGRYTINNESLSWARNIISKEKNETEKILIIDEVGRLEINGGGWKNNIDTILSDKDQILIMTVRKDYLNEVIKYFRIENYSVYEPYESNLNLIIKNIQGV
jgi:nucleoside-triphosphatase THEP1